MRPETTKRALHPLTEINKTSWVVDCVEFIPKKHDDTVPYRCILKSAEKIWK